MEKTPREKIIAVIERLEFDDTVENACKVIGIDTKTLYNRLKEEGDLAERHKNIPAIRRGNMRHSTYTKTVEHKDPDAGLKWLERRDAEFRPKSTFEINVMDIDEANEILAEHSEHEREAEGALDKFADGSTGGKS